LSTVVSLHEHHHMREHCSRRYGLIVQQDQFRHVAHTGA